MIHVCDAIMGTGKSSAAITYVNEHPGDRFIYITPFLDEAERIANACNNMNFVEPKKLKEYEYSKVSHTQHLIEQGKNVATTHASFKNYTPSMLEAIKKYEYTLIVDENVDVVESLEIHPDDIRILIDSGYVSEDNGTYTLLKEEYKGKALIDVFRTLKSRQLYRLEDDKKGELFFWVLPPDLFTSFKDVFILTYLFEGQSIHHFMEIYNLGYERIGIERDSAGTFRFGEYPGYIPDYVTRLTDMLDIYDGDMNSIGDKYHSLSVSWFDRASSDIDSLKNNIYNYFRWKHADTSAVDRMWSTFKTQKDKLKGKGYTNGFVHFNAKATNKHRHKTVAAYAVNIFMNVGEKKFYSMNGIDVDEGEYALSIMLQWIWRSAIRDGERIHLYIPSRRMRELLISWIERTMKGGNTVE